VVRPPAMREEPTYKVKVEDNNVLIKSKKNVIANKNRWIFI
jgi:hypothetical protein